MRRPLLSSCLVVALVALTDPWSSARAQERDSSARPNPRNPTLPLKTTRTVSFTTDEGTWISLDVSPDGRTIVFDLVGDLYTMPISGGKATRITDGPAFDAQPRFSPDGKTIVFASDRSGGENLWFIDANGKNPRPVTRGDKNQYVSPVWAPDGSGVVVSRATDPYASTYDLYFFFKDGGSGVRLLGAPPAAPGAAPAPAGRGGATGFNNYVGAAFGKDPRYVYVAARTGGFGYNQTAFAWSIIRLDRETGLTDPIARAPGSAMRPMLSPDGRYLVYATRQDTSTGLRVRELETGEERWLLRNVQRDDQESRWTRDLLPNSAFTPDGSALILYYNGKIWRADIASGRMTNIPFTADVDQRLGPLAKFDYPINDSTLIAQQIRDAHPSPDGRRLAFTSLDRLWTIDLPEGTPRRLTKANTGEFDPTWSPDGAYIAYVTWSDSTGGQVMRVRADGRAPPEAVSRRAAFYSRPGFSPNGSRIVVTMAPRAARLDDAINGGTSELVWFPAAGGAPTRIGAGGGGRGGAGEGAPYFVRGDSSRIYIGGASMRWDGTERRTHVSVANGSSLQISPSGDRAIVRVTNNLFLFSVAMAGDNPTAITVSPPAGASVPARQITRVGGEFLGWARDGKSFHYSLGRHFFRYVIAVADSAIADSTTRAESAPQGRGGGGAARAEAGDSTAPSRAIYEPEHYEIVIRAAKDKPSGVVALRGARIISMNGNEIIQNGDLVVRNNRILAIGPRGKVDIPRDAKVLDVSGKTIIPGLVDVHWHGGQDTDEHKSQLWQYWATLAWGTTTTRNPQTSTTDVLAYSDMVETGEMMGPRIYSTGPGVFATDRITTLAQARDIMRRYSEYWNTETLKQYDTGERKVRQWVVMAAREQGITPTNENYLDMKKNITQVLDGYAGAEHPYPIYPLYKDFVQLHAQSGLTYTPTLIVNFGGPFGENHFYQTEQLHADPKVRRFIPHSFVDQHVLRRSMYFSEDQFIYRQLAEQAAKIVAAGGRVGLGAHGQFNGPGAHWELWMLQSGGMSRHDALRVATRYGAESIGLGKDLGSLEPGKLADLLVLDKNPLDDIRNSASIKWVMKNGRIYEGATLDEVWPRQIKREALFSDQ